MLKVFDDNAKWAKDVWVGIRKRVDPFIAKMVNQPDWLLSGLMMYWKSKATQVYTNSGVCDGKAPVPTPRFGSAR